MYEEPLLGGRSSSKSSGHAQHLQQFLYAGDDDDMKNAKRCGQDEQPMGLHTMTHQLNSFFAVLWPVCITMLCASLIACQVHDDGMKHAMTAYMYYQNIDSSSDSIGQKSVLAFCNALIVIGLIACLTVGVVLLYKFNCMRFFLGYCVFYSAMLLGLAGSKIAVIVLCNQWHWIVDAWSLFVVMYNFAVVGVLSIFYQKGIPATLEQGYLVATSVIVAWQLSQLSEWSIWMILLLLGFWDLFAVMTPIGPLRWLVDLVHEKGTPLPGLLFQANIVDAHIGANSKMPSDIQSMKAAPLATEAKDLQKSHGSSPITSTSKNIKQSNEVHEQEDDDDDNDYDDKTIKLGLGDFIFYSVLVARAAMHGIAVFAPCFLCILVGLATTMHLLGKFDALPALPISIFLSILAYLLTTALFVPFLEQLTLNHVVIF